MILDGKSVSKHIKLDLQEKIKTLEIKIMSFSYINRTIKR